MRKSEKKEGSKGDEISLASNPVPKAANAAFGHAKRKCGMKGLLALFSSYLIPDLGTDEIEEKSFASVEDARLLL